jgi:proline iminopeptidase
MIDNLQSAHGTTSMPESVRRESEIFFHTVGNGQPMLVVHGGLGLDHTYLFPYLNAFADRVALIYLDLYGNGRSARPKTSKEWSELSLENWAEDLEAVREAVGAEKVLVFGHSLGGAIAQEYALRHPAHVTGLILCSTYVAFDYAELALDRALSRATLSQRDVLMGALGSPVSTDDELARIFAALLPLYFHRSDHPAVRSALAMVRPSADAFNQSFNKCLPGFSSAERLPNLDVPTLVIGGDDDWIAPVEHTVGRFARILPKATIRLIEESGHFPFIEQPARFNRAVNEWLEATVGSALLAPPE